MRRTGRPQSEDAMLISAKCTRTALAGAVLLGVAGVGARTQTSGGHSTIGTQSPGASQIYDPMHPKSTDDGALPPDISAKQGKARNDERQRRLVADTDKLLSLATSLHEDVAKTTKDVMSLDVIRRADEIEKLAKSVKDRMKG